MRPGELAAIARHRNFSNNIDETSQGTPGLVGHAECIEGLGEAQAGSKIFDPAEIFN